MVKNIIVFLFFFCLLCLGLSIYRDYGVHWDEVFNRNFGNRWANYVETLAHTHSIHTPLPNFVQHDLIHGPAFEIFLASSAKLLRIHDSRDVLFMRHLSIFLLFYIGTVFFYLLGLHYFKNWKLALLGCAFLVLSPRIFADAFYNTVDIAFLVFFVISIYTLLIALDKKRVLSTLAHALCSAILVAIRIIGFLLPLITIIFFSLEILHNKHRRDKIIILKILTIYLLYLALFIITLNPFLWLDPLGNFMTLLIASKNFSFYRYDLYLGHFILVTKHPWHYVPVWLSVTTPLLYSTLFIIGFLNALYLFLQKNTPSQVIKRDTAIILCWLFLPLFFAHCRVYNGWRHVYFIYPAFLIFSLIGTRFLWQLINQTFNQKTKTLMHTGLIFLISLSFFDTASFMMRNHPYQNIYFNRLIGPNINEATKKFSLDYWGLSYRKALEYILKNDNAPLIPIFVLNSPGEYSIGILPPKDRTRFYFTPVKKSKYYLTDDMQHPYPYDNNEEYAATEYYSVKVDGMKILIVFKLK